MAFSGSALQKVLINLTNRPVHSSIFATVDEGTISNDFVHAVYEDKSGSLWVEQEMVGQTGQKNRQIHSLERTGNTTGGIQIPGITRSNTHQAIK
jgi:hypothetical protein